MIVYVNIGAVYNATDVAGALHGADMDRDRTMYGPCWMAVGDTGTITAMGTGTPPAGEHLDMGLRHIMPAMCDSHTHIIYAGSRAGEFTDKINGLDYETIARRGGGILNSADLLARTPEDDLYRQSLQRLAECRDQGTGLIEIKSGYGLDTPGELKMLRVASRLARATDVDVRITWLAAHAVARAFAGRQQEYVDYVVDDMLPAVAAQGLAHYVDVFCDRGFFTPAQTGRILEAAARHGMRPKIHAHELADSGGVETGVAHGALSVDHLERAGEAQWRLLARSSTVATMLPGTSFFLGIPYGNARAAVDAGCAVALASDFNPGSSPAGDMRFVMAQGCIKMGLRPLEALNAVTTNGAAAMGLAHVHGSLAPGRKARFAVMRPGMDLVHTLYMYRSPWLEGMVIY